MGLRGPKPIQDEYANRDDLTRSQKYLRRHPEVKERLKIWKSKNLDKIKPQDKSYYDNFRISNPQKYLWQLAKARAKKLKREFTITIGDVVIPKYCPVMDMELKFSDTKGVSPSSPTIDRVDNSKGYTPKNIRVISHKANTNKKNMTRDMVQRLLDYIDGKI